MLSRFHNFNLALLKLLGTWTPGGKDLSRFFRAINNQKEEDNVFPQGRRDLMWTAGGAGKVPCPTGKFRTQDFEVATLLVKSSSLSYPSRNLVRNFPHRCPISQHHCYAIAGHSLPKFTAAIKVLQILEAIEYTFTWGFTYLWLASTGSSRRK